MARTCVRSDNARALYVASVLSRVHAHDCTHARTRSMLKLTFFTLACLNSWCRCYYVANTVKTRATHAEANARLSYIVLLFKSLTDLCPLVRLQPINQSIGFPGFTIDFPVINTEANYSLHTPGYVYL